jgi:sulfide dehydrogenase cytochrome subunit
MKSADFRILAAATLALGLASQSAAAQTAPLPASGAVLASTCSGCHGKDAGSVTEIPPIFGRTEAQLVQALQEFKTDRRPATVMNRHAKGFSDEEIVLIAREIAAKWR